MVLPSVLEGLALGVALQGPAASKPLRADGIHAARFGPARSVGDDGAVEPDQIPGARMEPMLPAGTLAAGAKPTLPSFAAMGPALMLSPLCDGQQTPCVLPAALLRPYRNKRSYTHCDPATPRSTPDPKRKLPLASPRTPFLNAAAISEPRAPRAADAADCNNPFAAGPWSPVLPVDRSNALLQRTSFTPPALLGPGIMDPGSGGWRPRPTTPTPAILSTALPPGAVPLPGLGSPSMMRAARVLFIDAHEQPSDHGDPALVSVPSEPELPDLILPVVREGAGAAEDDDNTDGDDDVPMLMGGVAPAVSGITGGSGLAGVTAARDDHDDEATSAAVAQGVVAPYSPTCSTPTSRPWVGGPFAHDGATRATTVLMPRLAFIHAPRPAVPRGALAFDRP